MIKWFCLAAPPGLLWKCDMDSPVPAWKDQRTPVLTRDPKHSLLFLMVSGFTVQFKWNTSVPFENEAF